MFEGVGAGAWDEKKGGKREKKEEEKIFLVEEIIPEGIVGRAVGETEGT